MKSLKSISSFACVFSKTENNPRLEDQRRWKPATSNRWTERENTSGSKWHASIPPSQWPCALALSSGWYFRRTDTPAGKAILSESFLPPLSTRSYTKMSKFASKEQTFLFWVDPFLVGTWCIRSRTEICQSYSPWINGGKIHQMYSLYLKVRDYGTFAIIGYYWGIGNNR